MPRQRALELFFLGCRILICYGAMIGFLAAPPVISANQYFTKLLQPLTERTGISVTPIISDSVRTYATSESSELIWVGRSEKSSLTQTERLHLLDVHSLLIWLSFLVGCAVILSILIEKEVIDERFARDSRSFMIGLSVVSVAAVVLFPVFFEGFHRVFFPQGNYSFSEDSLIIQCFPPAFWLLNVLWLQSGVLFLVWWQARHAQFLDI